MRVGASYKVRTHFLHEPERQERGEILHKNHTREEARAFLEACGVRGNNGGKLKEK